MGYIFRRFHCALVKMVKVRERTAVAGRSPVGVTGVLGIQSVDTRVHYFLVLI